MIDTQFFGSFGLMMLMLGQYFSSIVARQILGFISFTLFVGGSKLGARSLSPLKKV